MHLEAESASRSMALNLLSDIPAGYRIDRRFGAVYDRAPEAADDLTAIRGIATREVAALNRLGVYFLEQVALWRKDECDCVAEELGMRPSVIQDEQWPQQAMTILQRRAAMIRPVAATSHTNSFLRTISFLACAMLVGFLFVYFLNSYGKNPIRGTLSAEITSLRVPTESRLVTSHIRPGDEVFSGDALLTLEKTEHLTLISLQEQKVRNLESSLQKAEAQAALDLEWRTRELDRELSDVRTRAQLIQEVKRGPLAPVRSAEVDAPIESARSEAKMVSKSREVIQPPQPFVPVAALKPPNSMVFFSGESGETSVNVKTVEVKLPEPPAPLLIPVEPTPVVLASGPKPASTSEEILSVEARTVEMRLRRLEELRAALPEQVTRAAGVAGMRLQLDSESRKLDAMRTVSREVAVVCPAYGKIGQVRYKPGDVMSPGEVMVKLLHTDRRFVVAFLPTSRQHEVELGAIVDVVFPGNQRFRGKIADLPMIADGSSREGHSFSSVRIEPVGKLWPEIPIGSQIEVVLN